MFGRHLGYGDSTWDTDGSNLRRGALFSSVPGVVELQEGGEVFAFDSFFAAWELKVMRSVRIEDVQGIEVLFSVAVMSTIQVYVWIRTYPRECTAYEYTWKLLLICRKHKTNMTTK
jgi:hypothetical protein